MKAAVAHRFDRPLVVEAVVTPSAGHPALATA
jgi:hypothetical protein